MTTIIKSETNYLDLLSKLNFKKHGRKIVYTNLLDLM